MTIYKSKRGDVGTESYWRQELVKFWDVVGEKGIPGHHKDFSEPVDSWSRYVKVLGLEEVENEEVNVHSSSSSYRGVF